MSEPDMRLPNGKTCANCVWWKRTCEWLLSHRRGTETECDWSPSRFIELKLAAGEGKA